MTLSRFESIGLLVTTILIARDFEDWDTQNRTQDKLEKEHGFRLAFKDTREPKERDALGGGWGYTAPKTEDET